MDKRVEQLGEYDDPYEPGRWNLKDELKHGWKYWPGLIVVWGVPLFFILKAVFA